MSKELKAYHGVSNYQGPGYYEHYKGGKYYVLGISVKEDTVNKGTETIDGKSVVMVIYIPLYIDGSMLPQLVPMDECKHSAEVVFWARELDDFNALVEIDHNNFVRRFEKN